MTAPRPSPAPLLLAVSISGAPSAAPVSPGSVNSSTGEGDSRPQGARRRQRLYDVMAIILIAMGVAVRIRAFFFDRSLWLDEASIALNITRRSYGGLLKPLWLAQAAPVGWLWLERSAVRLFGNSDLSLRAPMLVSGVLAMPLFWWIARKVLRPGVVPLAVGLFVTSTYVIYYSNEVKPYESDVLIGLILLALSLPLLAADIRLRSLVAWSLTGALFIWFSLTSALLFGGLFAGLILGHLFARRLKTPMLITIGALPFAVSFAADYIVSLRAESKNPDLLGFWAKGFLPRPLSMHTATRWLWSTWQSFVGNPLALWGALVLLALAVSGLVALGRRDQSQSILLASCLLPFLAAACLHKYPLRGRLVLILVPIALLAIVSGVTLGPAYLRIGAYTFLAATLAVSATKTAVLLQRPQRVEETRAVVAYIRDHRAPRDVVLVENFARPAFAYYGQRLGVHQDGTFEVRQAPAPTCTDLSAIAAIARGRRVWVVFGKTRVAPTDQERALARFDRFGTRVDAVARHGSAAFLYDPASGPLSELRPTLATSPSACLDVVPGGLPI